LFSTEGVIRLTETNVFQLSQPGTFADPLTEVLRNGARALLVQAVEAEVAALLHAERGARGRKCFKNRDRPIHRADDEQGKLVRKGGIVARTTAQARRSLRS
jgi:hypothetical protein